MHGARYQLQLSFAIFANNNMKMLTTNDEGTAKGHSGTHSGSSIDGANISTIS